MQRHLQDADTLSDLGRNPQGVIAQRIEALAPDAIATSVIVAAELRYGAAKKASRRLIDQVAAILDRLTILPIEPLVAVAYARIRCDLEAAGTPIGGNDLLIAAQARTLGCCVVTGNVREFSRITELQVENWLEDKRPR